MNESNNGSLPDAIKQKAKVNAGQVISQAFGLIASAFVLVAALAWNDLVKDVISTYLKTGSGLLSRLAYAIIVTIIAATVAVKFSSFAKKISENDNQNQP